MGYELRTQTIEPVRNTFRALIDRFGDKPASRYQEGTYELQPMANFHYRPFWDPEHEIYDPDYSAVKLTDPYTYSDPRQYYYATYVAARADHYDSFGKDLKYIEERDLFARLPENWHGFVTHVIVPLRHYESGAQLISINGCRFAWGTTISQPAGFAAMDRIGNAQLLSMIGLAMAGGSGEKLAEAKHFWLEQPSLQGLRELTEQALIEPDWVSGVLALELTDAQLYPVLFRHCETRALFHGAMAYSLLAQHFTRWYADHQKWLTALLKAWVDDPQYGDANRKALGAMADRWYPQAREAVNRLAADIERSFASTSIMSAATRHASELAATLEKIGIPLTAPGGVRS
ncbi:phenol 2-monooxygenase [Mycobacterium intracellulare]|uniref:phenol 2-monooxygenase n=1 Tax=Mycobacterium intracellulare TaxID=1767 RepID=UPI000BAB1228|nr:phenol 2-monooxygenase [Mycobacterium intracellulare]ASW96790.1 phenol 2-monooxygenase [Mycobacterium intracellulare]PBA19527.1 phenol 2-monooxygenase [Mycobacterium intracellulare]